MDPMTVASIVSTIVSSWQEMSQDTTSELLKESVDRLQSEIEQVRRLLDAFSDAALKKLFDARIAGAKSHLETAQDDLTSKRLEEARDNLRNARHSLVDTLADLLAYSDAEGVGHEQVYFDAVMAALGNLVAATTLYCGAVNLEPRGSQEVNQAFQELRASVETALNTVRVFSAKHFVLSSQRYNDGALKCIKWGYKLDGGNFIEVCEGLLKASADLKRIAQDAVAQAAEKRSQLVPEFSAISQIEANLP